MRARVADHHPRTTFHTASKLDFQEVDRQYAELVRKREDGSISEEEFDTERQRLMVLDKEGRWWAKSATTGEWNYHDGNDWVPGVPPDYQPDPEHGESPASESQDSERRFFRRPLWRLALLVALLLLILLGVAAYVVARGTNNEVAVPDVIGASVDEAKQKLKKAGFDSAVEKVHSDKPVGIVVSTDPEPGKLMDPASVNVIIKKSSGPPPSNADDQYSS